MVSGGHGERGAGRPDDAAEPRYTVGQVAGMLNVQPAFLRRLDTQGVVHPERSGGNQRRYNHHQVEQVRQVCALIGDGLTLAGIRMVLRLQARVTSLESEVARLRRATPDDPPSAKALPGG